MQIDDSQVTVAGSEAACSDAGHCPQGAFPVDTQRNLNRETNLDGVGSSMTMNKAKIDGKRIPGPSDTRC